jgi:hypothetical protein
MRALLLCTMVAGVVGGLFVACNPNSIGRPCVNPEGSDVRGTQVSSPALECPSRLCLIQPANASGSELDGGARATCTAECSNDGDCAPETDKFCKKGFVCAVVASTGPFCCRKVCTCRDDLDPNFNLDRVDGGAILPTSCNPKTFEGTGTKPQCPNVKVP